MTPTSFPERSMAKANIPEKGAIVQRDLETFAIHPHIPGGFADPALLRKIADVAEKYGAKYVKLTGAQRIIIIGIKEEDLDKAWAEFSDQSKAIGLTIRSIQMCPGTRSCKKAKQDSPELGLALDKKYYGQPAPAKFKMGIATNLNFDQAMALADKVITFYKENGKTPERLGATIERVGIETFKKAVL